MFRILAIGNSFSEDATYFLHQILEDAGIKNQVVNLFIGGCPLEKHWANIEGNRRDYEFQLNGRKTDRFASIPEVLVEAKWDAIVTQQASHDSGWLDSYEPFLGLMVDYIREKTGDTPIYLHETWAYAKDSTHNHFMRYHRDQQEMYERLKANYSQMAEKYQLSLIPTGDLVQALRATEAFNEENGRYAINRDGFHLGYLYGRYAAACMWAKTICKANLSTSTYVPYTDNAPLEEADPEVLALICASVKRIAEE